MSIHTIPVPRGMSPEQAWEMIKRGQKLDDPYPNWANIEIDDKQHYRRLFRFYVTK